MPPRKSASLVDFCIIASLAFVAQTCKRRHALKFLALQNKQKRRPGLGGV